MSNIPTCYDGIIGITRTECTCYGDIAADYEVSNSGLYLDELELLQWMNGLTGCENGSDVFEVMYKAVQEAEILFPAEATALLMKKYKLKRRAFKGKIGRLIFDAVETGMTVGTYYGHAWYLNDIKGGYITITNISTLFDTNAGISLLIYNSLGELVDTVALATLANNYQTNVVDIELPMHDDSVDNLEYYFLYLYDGVTTPLNNRIDEDCVSCISHGQQKSQANNQYYWQNYLNASGIKKTALTEFNAGCNSTSNIAYGLSFDIKIGCKVDQLFCLDEMDFLSDPLAMLKAEAIRFKAANLLITRLLRSNNLNYNNMVNREQLLADQLETANRWNELLGYIVENTDIMGNDCLTCKNPLEFRKSTIIAL